MKRTTLYAVGGVAIAVAVGALTLGGGKSSTTTYKFATVDRGDVVSTLTPEFGPPSYLHTRPEDNSPLVDLEEVCNWMARRQSARFEVGSTGACHH